MQEGVRVARAGSAVWGGSRTRRSAGRAWTSSWRETKMQEYSVDCNKIDFDEIKRAAPHQRMRVGPLQRRLGLREAPRPRLRMRADPLLRQALGGKD